MARREATRQSAAAHQASPGKAAPGPHTPGGAHAVVDPTLPAGINPPRSSVQRKWPPHQVSEDGIHLRHLGGGGHGSRQLEQCSYEQRLTDGRAGQQHVCRSVGKGGGLEV